jgi:hypothetical protein
MPNGLDVYVEDNLESAIRALRRKSAAMRTELRTRQRQGPKPSDKRRDKEYFAQFRRRHTLVASAPDPLPAVFRRGARER